MVNANRGATLRDSWDIDDSEELGKLVCGVTLEYDAVSGYIIDKSRGDVSTGRCESLGLRRSNSYRRFHYTRAVREGTNP